MESESGMQRLQSEILTNIDEGIVVIDSRRRVALWNRTAERLSGIPAREALGSELKDHRTCFWLNPGEEQAAAEALSHAGVWRGEKRCTGPGGQQISLETTVSAMKDAGGALVGTLVVIRDVTERRREKELHDITERRLRGALKVGRMGYLDWDLSTDFILWSDETYRMYGVEPGPEPPTIDFTVGLVHPEDREFVQKHLEAVVQGKAEYDIEHRMVRPDGRVITVHAQGEVSRDAAGNPLRMLGTILDITEHKKAEEERRRSHELLKQVIASLDEAVLVVNQTERLIIECNQTAEWMFGYRRKDLLGQSTRMLHVDNEMFERFLHEMLASIRSHGYWRSHFQMKRKTGVTFPAEFFVRPIRDGNEGDVCVGIIRDLSESIRAEKEKRELETQLVQAQKMEAIGQLAGGVAHDFNNLLTVINGYAAVTLGRLSSKDPLYEDITEILQAGQRAAALTQQLLAFSRKQIVQPRPLDLNQVVAEDENMLQRLLGEHIRLKVSLSPTPVCVLADPGQVQQVIINLVVNARDAVAQGGSVAIETGNVDLDNEQASKTGWVMPGPYGTLTISDDGVGMDAETRARIFEPFFTTKEMGRGTGLGLSTVYGIVRQSNGAILVESELGRGTTFRIFLPIVEGTVVERASVESQPAALHGTETVLLVEDEREVRKLTGAMLRGFGYKVIEAANAGEAFLICEQAPDQIALMVTDVVMPGMTGWQLAERLQKMRPGMKVIYISGYADEELTKRGALQNGVHFVQKPFDPQTLAAKIRELLTIAK